MEIQTLYKRALEYKNAGDLLLVYYYFLFNKSDIVNYSMHLSEKHSMENISKKLFHCKSNSRLKKAFTALEEIGLLKYHLLDQYIVLIEFTKKSGLRISSENRKYQYLNTMGLDEIFDSSCNVIDINKYKNHSNRLN